MATSPSRILSDLRARPATRFFVTITRAVPGFAVAWWALLLVRALVPAGLAITTGVLVGRVEGGGSLTGPLAAFGIFFVLSQVGPPVHQVVGAMARPPRQPVLNDRLMATTLGPDGVGHLERGDLTNDLTTARDFDLGWTGPPMFMNMDFIAQGLAMLLGGIASALVLFGFTWWAPLLLLAAWGSTHWLLRESGVWRDRNTDEVKSARRHTDYAYDLATEPAAAKEVRLFGLVALVARALHTQPAPPPPSCSMTRRASREVAHRRLLIVLSANALVFVVLARRGYAGSLDLPVGRHLLRRGVRRQRDRLRRAQLGARRRSGPRRRDPAPRGRDGGGRRPPRYRRHQRAGDAGAGDPVPRRGRSPIPTGSRPVLDGSTSPSRPARRWRSSARTAPARPPSPSCSAASTTPTRGSIEIDGVDLRDLDLVTWRSRVAAVFQDFVRYELPLRDNVAPAGAPDRVIERALDQAGALDLADLGAPVARGYRGRRPVRWPVAARCPGPSDREGRHPVRTPSSSTSPPPCSTSAAGPEIFRADARRDPRRNDHPGLSPLLDGPPGRADLRRRARPRPRVGSHDDLIALRGRYHTMYDLQASRFHDEKELDEHGEEVVHESL